MDAELKALDEKIRQLVELCQRLRDQNIELRQKLAASQNESKRLGEKIGSARARLEGLLEKIPEGKE
jgi:cell division protein ZapB